MPSEPIFHQLDLFLQDEKNTASLYQSCAEREAFAEIRARYRAFAADCQRHLQLLHNLVALLGGRAQGNREAREASDQLAEALLNLAGVNAGLARLHRIEALLTAERKCQSNWSLLHSVADHTPSSSLEEAVHQVQPDKVMHVEYLEDLYRDLGLRLLSASLAQAVQARPTAQV